MASNAPMQHLPNHDLKITLNGHDHQITYIGDNLDTENNRPIVLLLHGASFSPQSWESIGTISSLAAWGFKVVAVNLHSVVNAIHTAIDGANVLGAVISQLGLQRGSGVVIVSPSMSGIFSVPYVLQEDSHVVGFIPIAPVLQKDFIPQFKSLQTKTLIVFGEQDVRAAHSTDQLKHIPNSSLVQIPGAGHACYMDKPDLWHQHLKHFLDSL